MRINVAIDEHMMAKALKSGQYETKKGAIEAGLNLLVQMNSKQKKRKIPSKMKWEGNLDEKRTN